MLCTLLRTFVLIVSAHRYPCYKYPEGNTLAATGEFVRLLEVSGSVTANLINGKTENIRLLGFTVEFNPMRTP